MIASTLKIVILEDNDADAEILQRLLKKNEYNFEAEVMMTREAYIQALNEFEPDLILSDNDMPQFSASEALEILQQYSLHIPFIMVTGTVSEEFAAGIIKAGADDYLLKDRLTRLPAAIEAALKQKQTEKEKTEAIRQLTQNEEKYRTLVEQAFDGIIIYSPEGIILDCNDSSCNYTGYLQNELKGLAITKLFSNDDLTARPLNFEILNAGHPTLDHRRLKRKDGAYIEMEIATKKMPDGNLMAVGRDITERKKAEAQRALFTSIVNSSDDAIISKTLGGIITSWNKGAETLFGYTAGEAIGKSIAIIIPVDRMTEEPAILEKIRKGEVVQHYETERIKKDGSRIFISLTASPVRDSHGIITGASKIARDITERKAAQQKIIQSEENLKAIFDNTSEGFILADGEGRVKAFNNRAKQSILIDIAGEIKTGRSIFDYVEESRKEFFEKIISRVMQGETIQYDRSYNDKDGRITWINFSFNPVWKGKSINGICITGLDITGKKKAEEEIIKSNERFELVVTATNDVIWDWDITTNILWRNKNYYSHFGYDEKTIPSDTSAWHDGIYPEDKERVLSGVNAIIKSQQHFWTDEYRFLKADKTVAFVLDCSYILYTEEGKPYRMVGAMLDITARKIAEAQLKKSFDEKQALAERMSTIINTLPANIALLDGKGFIVDVNDAWKNFADGNGLIGGNYGIGDNYIDISKNSIGEDKTDAEVVAQGIESVLKNKIKEFVHEYSCHSPTEKRWFRMVVSPLHEKEYAGAVVMHVDISELVRLEQERLKSKTDEQKRITLAMIQGQEKERNAIGIELHDNVNQILVGTNLLLRFIKDNPEKTDELIQGCIDNISNAVQENRKIAHELVTPNQVAETLVEQISRLSQTMLVTGGVKAYINHENFNEALLNDDQKLAIYRMAQEQCTNIIKYANAQQVVFTLTTSDNIFSFRIKDDGQGMAAGKAPKGIGLRNIAGRLTVFAGKVNVESEPGKGFMLEIEIPLG